MAFVGLGLLVGLVIYIGLAVVQERISAGLGRVALSRLAELDLPIEVTAREE